MLTAEIIRSLAPRARQDYVDALLGGGPTFERFGITTPIRMAAFLAQILHETGGLTLVREDLRYSKENLLKNFKKRYAGNPALAAAHAGNAKLIGNFNYGFRMGNERNGINDDDGWRYRGGGMIQLTGYDSYKGAGDAIGADLVGHPELIEDASISLAAACWEFSQWLKYADMGERGFRSVCCAINIGSPTSTAIPNGWSDRQLKFKQACDALGVTGHSDDDTLKLGDRGPLVTALQERLTALGYAVGRADGVYGSRMRAAVAAFQLENGSPSDGVIGPKTRAALNSESAKSMPLGERATETAADLKAAGSETIATAQAIKNTAKGILGIGAAGGAAQQAAPAAVPADAISATKDIITEVGSWRVITNALSETFAWATSHWWIFAIVAAFAFYRWGDKIEIKRVLSHRLGLNLER